MNLTLFDLDGTLLPFDSNQAFGAYLTQLGWCDGPRWQQRQAEFHRAHDLGLIDVHAYIDFVTESWRDRSAAEVEQARASFMHQHLRPSIPPASLALTAGHRAAGDTLVLVTATNEFLAEPIARAFGIDHLIAIRLQRDAEGRVTGAIDGTPSLGAGKVDRLEEWLVAEGLSLTQFERVTFYGDSVNDLPLMVRATHPVAVNPSPALRVVAEQRGWKVIDS